MVSLMLTATGIGFISLQLYVEVHMRFDDKYLTKKDTNSIVKELQEKQINEGGLNIWDIHNLKSRTFIQNRTMLKAGLILLAAGAMLEFII